MKLKKYCAVVAITWATVVSSQAATVFTDGFTYTVDNAMLAEGGWTAWNGSGGSDAGTGLFWGNASQLEYNYTVGLAVGDTITMDATVSPGRTSNGSAGVNGYAYTMEIFLWDGADVGTITSVAGGVQQGLSANLTQVSYTALAGDAGKEVIFRQGNTGPGTGAGGGWGETTSVTYDITPVPEPSSTALLGLGGLALILRRRK